METGHYRKRPIDWRKFEVDVFAPHLFNTEGFGCGANALAMITGVPPHYIHNTNRQNISHWKDSFMVKFLKDRGFMVHHLTKCDVSNSFDSLYANDGINDKHVIMFSQLMNKNTASWSVVHNKLWYHNYQTCSFQGLNLVNSPSLTCYLICHPKWRRENWVDTDYKK